MMSLKRSSSLLCAVSLLSIAICPAFAAEKVERLAIVDRSIEYHGGEIFGASISSFDQCSKSGCYSVRSRVEGGLFDHHVSTDDGSRQVHVTNDIVERWQDGDPVDVDPDDRQRWRDWVSQRVYFPFLPYHLNDASVYKEDLGLVEWEGKSLHLVKVSFEPDSSSSASSEFLYWFDPETARMEQFAYSFEGGLRLRLNFNFRRVGGILFTDSRNLGIDGEDMSVDVVTPEYVSEHMPEISVVRLKEISVDPLQ